MLDHPKAYRKAYEDPGLLYQWTWRRQADRLHQVYRDALAAPAD